MITLKYMDNLCRQEVGTVDVRDIATQDDGASYLLAIYQNAGFENAIDPARLRLVTDQNDPLMIDFAKLDDDATILYSAVVIPENALEYHREDGIKYFFHTSEEGHLGYPHIHAEKAGEKISVYFSDFHVEGKMKSPAEQRKVIKYVKAHVDDLQREWDRIIQSQRW